MPLEMIEELRLRVAATLLDESLVTGTLGTLAALAAWLALAATAC